MKKIVRQSQLSELVENPIVEVIKDILNLELDAAYEARASAFISGEPIKTQEIRAGILGEESRIQDFLELLNNDNSTGVFDRYFGENGVEIVED